MGEMTELFASLALAVMAGMVIHSWWSR